MEKRKPAVFEKNLFGDRFQNFKNRHGTIGRNKFQPVTAQYILHLREIGAITERLEGFFYQLILKVVEGSTTEDTGNGFIAEFLPA